MRCRTDDRVVAIQEPLRGTAICSDRLDIAYATLLRGSAFLGCGTASGGGAADRSLTAGAGGAKLVGNGLRELDRFLSLLLDEAARWLAPAGFDGAAFGRQRNVANKLGCVHRLAGLPAPDRERVRAIGRVRDCLHHCRGIVHDPAVRGDLRRAAMAGDPPRDVAERLALTASELTAICRFYSDCAGDVMAACAGVEARSLTFAGLSPR